MKPSKTAFPVDAIARNLNSPSLSEPTDCRSSPVAVRLINVSALSRRAVREGSEGRQWCPGAFDKAVRTWPPGFAADAGGYVNSIVGRNGVKVCRGCARSPGDETAWA